MLASGNSAPQVCVLNLLRTVRGEVPYARTKGIDRALVDAPATEAWRVEADADWVVSSYEPRASVDDVLASATAVAGSSGDLTVLARLRG